MRSRIVKIVAGVAALVVLGLGGAAIAGAAGAFDDEGASSVGAATADRAGAAALAITGGGRVNAVERDSEAGATYEVEVTRKDGTTVDVRLDKSFGLVVVDGDSESESKSESSQD